VSRIFSFPLFLFAFVIAVLGHFMQVGVMVMTHGDDKGLVLPPRVAPVQVIVIPVPYKDADTTAIKGACESTVYTLNQSGIRTDLDIRENYSPGWKYSHWEMKGVPLRIEIGPKDMANKQVLIAELPSFISKLMSRGAHKF
jgi:prolyl-tRNA synthetase